MEFALHKSFRRAATHQAPISKPDRPNSCGISVGSYKISAVVLKEKFFNKTALDKMTSDVAAAHAAQAVNSDLLTAIDRTHVH